MKASVFTPEHIDRCWREALALWDVQVRLGPPEPHAPFQPDAPHANEPLAYIDLVKRQVYVHFTLLTSMGAEDSLTAVLAHEIGHHARFPHTLGWDAQLRVMEQRLIPGLKQSLTNLFYDLQVNEVVGRTHAEDLCRVYRGFQRTAKPAVSPLFHFYLAIYEELWGLPPGDLVPKATLRSMEEAYPGTRAEARMFAQTFYALPDPRLQFLYFCAAFIRYLERPDELTYMLPLGGDVPMPDVDDLDGALQSGGLWEEALEEARARDWLDAAAEGKAQDPLDAIDRITHHMPGHEKGQVRRALVSRHYRRLVDQHILPLPAAPSRPEPYLRTTPQAWEYGDDPSAIDWTLTVLSQGHLAAVSPLRRELEADVPPSSELGVAAVELYLDTSGSMPNPAHTLNSMTLAAQVLAASAVRKKAMVRGVVYSSGPPLVSPWMYDEETARDFLLHYVGGGTDYPFEVLTELSRERPDALRVIISDSDFLANVGNPEDMRRLVEATRRSRLVVALLALPDERRARQVLQPALKERGFRLVVVQWMSDFGPAAADLARALLEK
ncbi:M48 family metalloprotease [Myxococcus sp. K15C18031901]|uniref:M48 family metalloprotease n=1 Tax=Myxococcus dinghuensis TaxID=2906761 RepID=UPI0020A70451|nr:M48 family metalloprotease [Myxococcus dinghuensis]MCP3099100.1 M48 family metalloprotease [Myxococcus dinghuensis]